MLLLSSEYLASPTHTDERQLLSGSVCSEHLAGRTKRSCAFWERKAAMKLIVLASDVL